MPLLSIKNLNCSQGIKTLFKEATFSIDATDKIAVVGPNGCGKSTLLSLLANSQHSPQKEIVANTGLRISTLMQDPDLNPNHSITEHLLKSNATSSQAIQNYHEALESYNNNPNEENENLYSRACEEMDHLDAWNYEEKVSSLLKELQITNLNQTIDNLSGGMRKKIALAQTFIEDSDLLILDEPTNHLDIQTIEWLEEKLKKHNGALLMVTHDRYFLDKVCTKIIEIDQESLFIYSGNYSQYLEKRDQRYQSQAKADSRLQSILRVELQWLKQGPKARSTKQRARKDRINEMMSQKPLSPQEMLTLSVSERRLGKKILKLKHITKSFNSNTLIHDFSYTLSKGDKIGIVGPNGIGKSTLLNLIMEKIKPDSGHIDVGINTEFGYFDQHNDSLDPNQSVYEHINEIGSQFIRDDGSTVSASKLLEQFQFPSTMLKTPIERLSGGERRRLQLVTLLLKNPNVLLFDEPTNDLDIQTLSILEDFLDTFSGCVILISHDRYFMDRVVNQLFIFDNNAKVLPFLGNYSDYTDTLKDIQSLKKPTKKAVTKKVTAPSKRKRNYSENREMQLLEKDIEELESKKKKIEAIFESTDSNPDDYKEAGLELKTINETLESKFSRWEELMEIE